MEDTVNRIEIIKKIAQNIDEMNGINTVVLDITAQSSWTDYFIITTVSSSAHIKGILRDLSVKLEEYNIYPQLRHKRFDSERWILIDCGDIVIHLMDKEAREFYELENLWFKSEVIYQSSKSS